MKWGGGVIPVALNLERRQKMYGLVLREKYGIEGISRNDVIELFDMLDDEELINLKGKYYTLHKYSEMN